MISSHCLFTISFLDTLIKFSNPSLKQITFYGQMFFGWKNRTVGDEKLMSVVVVASENKLNKKKLYFQSLNSIKKEEIVLTHHTKRCLLSWQIFPLFEKNMIRIIMKLK